MDRHITADRSHKRAQWALAALGGVALLLVGGGWIGRRFAPPAPRWYPVAARIAGHIISGRATILPARVRVIAAAHPGTVIEQRARVGDHLVRGSVLVVMASPALSSELMEAQQKLALAKADQRVGEASLIDEKMARQMSLMQSRDDMQLTQQQATAKQQLVEQGAISRLDLTSALLQASQAKARYHSNQERMQQLVMAQAAKRASLATLVHLATETVADLKAEQEGLTVQAAADGWLTRLEVTPGQHVNAGSVIAEVIGGDLYADIEVAEVDAPTIKPGSSIDLSSSIGNVRAVVQTVMPRAIEGSVHVRARLLDPPSWLRADMTLNARIISTAAATALFVPTTEAFVENSTQRVRRRRGADAIATTVLVHFGQSDGRQVEVISGVQAGDQISPIGRHG